MPGSASPEETSGLWRARNPDYFAGRRIQGRMGVDRPPEPLRPDLIEKEVALFIQRIRGTAPEPTDYGSTTLQ